MRSGIVYFATFSMIILLYFLGGGSDWKAPPEADKLSNPVKGAAQYTAQGKEIFEKVCWTCHGDNGKGKGPASGGLHPRPADFSSGKVQSQTDGAIFWKLSEGRGSMPSYKNTYTEIQRWGLVNYIRQFGDQSVSR